MPKAVCVQCQCFLKIKKNDVRVVETFSPDGDTLEPYQVYHADLWECPVCHVVIVLGFGAEPVLQHWEDDFDKKLNQAGRPFFYANDIS